MFYVKFEDGAHPVLIHAKDMTENETTVSRIICVDIWSTAPIDEIKLFIL